MTWINANTTKSPANEAVLLRTTAGNYRVGFYSPHLYGAGAWIELSSNDWASHHFSPGEIEWWARIETQTEEPQP